MTLKYLTLGLFAIILASCGDNPVAFLELNDSDYTRTDSGLEYYVIKEGSGDLPNPGDRLSVDYEGWLTNGKKFDSSVDRQLPFAFRVGSNPPQVIAGWDEALATMRPGEKRQLRIPPDLAYGSAGAGSDIPGDATLIFEVTLNEIIPDTPLELEDSDYEISDSGLGSHKIRESDGSLAGSGTTVVVHYTGWLEDGTMFDNSWDRRQPISFTIDGGQVIAGWEEGLLGMRVGEARQLRIPPQLGYGSQGAGGGAIPPDATLIFQVRLYQVR